MSAVTLRAIDCDGPRCFSSAIVKPEETFQSVRQELAKGARGWAPWTVEVIQGDKKNDYCYAHRDLS